MILISVKSEIYNDKRQFESDEKAFKFLKLVANIHLLSRLQRVGKKPKRKEFKSDKHQSGKRKHAHALKIWNGELSIAIPLHIEIINTKSNQLNLL